MRLIYGLRSDLRGRLNAVYMATGFIGGAAGAALGSITFSAGGWWLTALTGMAMALLAGGYFLTEQPAALAAARTANS